MTTCYTRRYSQQSAAADRAGQKACSPPARPIVRWRRVERCARNEGANGPWRGDRVSVGGEKAHAERQAPTKSVRGFAQTIRNGSLMPALEDSALLHGILGHADVLHVLGAGESTLIR